MPTLRLSISPPQDTAKHQALAVALTHITAQTLGKRAAVTAVLVDERPARCWYVGGEAVQRATALLEISITAGTNSVAQKADFIAQAHAELQRQLAPEGQMETASYVTVQEVAGSDWGYGGFSQQARQQGLATPTL